MAELPASWKLRTKRRGNKVDVIGKDDNGQEYKVRTCDGGVTDADVAAIRECDREQYKSRADGARAYVQSVIEMGKQAQKARADEFESDLIEAAGPVVHAGLERRGLTVGSSRAYRENYDRVFGEN